MHVSVPTQRLQAEREDNGFDPLLFSRLINGSLKVESEEQFKVVVW